MTHARCTRQSYGSLDTTLFFPHPLHLREGNRKGSPGDGDVVLIELVCQGCRCSGGVGEVCKQVQGGDRCGNGSVPA